MSADVIPFPVRRAIELRPYRAPDALETASVFRQAVHVGAAGDYNPAQRDAWAPQLVDHIAWVSARSWRATWVAELQGQLVGFADLSPDGEIEMLYVHPAFTRLGVGGALLGEVERAARDGGVACLHADVSLTAQRLFLRQGFTLLEDKIVEVRGERLMRTAMEKMLEPVFI